MDDPIERYLDDLFLALRDDPRQARRLVREAEDHLREQQEEMVAGGMAPDAAAVAAVGRFGSVSQIVDGAKQEDRAALADFSPWAGCSRERSGWWRSGSSPSASVA